MTDTTPELTTASPDEWATEQRRRFLLSAMGVTPLISRRDWPGARVAERRAAPYAPEPSAVAVSAAANLAARQTTHPSDQKMGRGQPRGQSPIAEIKRQSAGAAAKPRLANPEPAPHETASAARKPDGQGASAATQAAPSAPRAADAVQFSLLICAGAGHLWIEALPERVLVNEQLSLTTAMARALDGGAAPLVYQQFDWPIVANPALPRDINTAKQSLGALLGRMRKEQAPRGVVLMGDCDVLPELGDTEVLRIPATLAMLETPTLKADAWAVLKPRVLSA